MTKKKSKVATNKLPVPVYANENLQTQEMSRQVRFNSSLSNTDTTKANNKKNENIKNTSNSPACLHRSLSQNTLNRLDRENYVLYKRPIWTIFYCVLEIFYIVRDFLKSLLHWRRLIPTTLLITLGLCSYFIPGPHIVYAKQFEKQTIWCLYWIWLGILSSIGLGTGLHTFVLYLGPFIAHVTLAAYECNSLDFPEPPYPTDITCPTGKLSHIPISLWDIIAKVRLESLMWGIGTAFGELPPYFMARAARVSGEEIDDEDYQEYLAFKSGSNDANNKNFLWRWKILIEQFMEEMIKKIGFPGVLVLASVPNPFFDLAGMTCGHFLIPFWSFFGATVIGKAIVKMHLQMLCVVIAFSEHHVEDLVNRFKWIPYIGESIQALIKEFLRAQKIRIHRNPTDPIPEQASSNLQSALNLLVTLMVGIFLFSLVNSLAQRYHKRQHTKKQIQQSDAVITPLTSKKQKLKTK